MAPLRFRQIRDGKWHYWGCFDNGFISPLSGDAGVKPDDSQQFTGLVDSQITEHEIFEGDIVRAVAHDRYANDSGIFRVIQGDDGQWQLARDGDRFGLPITWGAWISTEVIGNIYENPDLLPKAA